jgi:hypothetical protein
LKVAGSCFAVSAGFGTSAGFGSEPFGRVGLAFGCAGLVSAGFAWAGFTSVGFAGAGFGSAGFAGAGLASICVDSFVSLASNSAILVSRSAFVLVLRLVAISYTKYNIVYVHCDQFKN